MRARSLRLIPRLLAAFACASLVVAVRAQVQVPTRQGQSTTTLADGRVLIAGGDADGTAEIFDPSTGQTSPLSSRMTVARASHGAVRLANANVLIVGGYAAGTTSVEQSAEIFDVETAQFAKVGGTRVARVLPALTLRADAVVVISGGDASGSVEFFDPAANTFGDDPAAPSIVTDRSDYAPGETVTFTGVRWAPSETVTIVLHEEPQIHANLTLTATADENGRFTNSDFVPEDHDLGVTFNVTATGLTTDLTATTRFTDAAAPSSTYSLTTGSGTILGGGTDIGNHCDDCSTTVVPPFPITFYNSVFSSMRVSSNGNIFFGGALFENPNFCLPTNVFGFAIMPYWDDLRTDLPSGSGKGIFIQTTGTAPNRQFHVRWETSYWQSAAPTYFGTAQFAVVFYESQPQIDFLYGPISGNSATVGVQRSSNGPATQYACNIGSVASGTRLTFTGVQITTATSTTLSGLPDPSGPGQVVSFVATVLWSGNAVTSGTVTLKDGLTTIGTASLNQNGEAIFPVSTLSVGSHTMMATYSGLGGLQPSTGTTSHTVNKGNTTTAVTLSTNPSVAGQAVTLTASVSPVAPATGTPTGAVQFKDAGVNLGSPVALVSGSAALSTTFTSVGGHAITAEYSGDATFNTSTSAIATQTVNKATTTTALASDINPLSFGQAVTFTATVSAAGPGSGIPAGTVQFRDNGVDIGAPAALTDGCATLTTSSLSTGTHLITAVYSGDANFNGSSSSTLSQVVNKATASIVFNTVDLTQTYNGSPRIVGYTTSPAGLSGVSITYNGSSTPPTDAGTYTVVAALTNTNYEAPNATGTLIVNKASASIALADLAHTYDGSPKSASATTTPAGLSGVTVTYDASPTAPTNAGSYAVVAVLTNANYAAPNATGTLVIAKASATIALADLAHTYDGSPQSASATTTPAGLTGVTITYDGSTVAPTNAGSYAVVAALTNANYEAPNATGMLVIAKASATIALADLGHTYDGSPKSASATTTPAALSGVTITYDGSTVAPTSAGSYAVVATLVNANYDAPPATGTLTISKAAQTITFAALANKTFGDADFTVSATASSNLAVTFSATGSCTVNGTTIHLIGAGSCTIRASQAGDTNYSAAPDVDQSFTIGKANQTITFAALADRIFGDGDFIVSATASSNLTVAFTASGACSVNGTSVHLTGAGSCTIRASQAGDTNYNAAADVDRSFTIGKANQTITFAAPANKTFGDTDFTVSATASSNLTVAFTASGACTINGNSVHITGAGQCDIRASQAGDANYNAAPDVERSFMIAKANQAIVITTGAPASAIYGTSFNTVATGGGSGNPVAIAVTGVCAVSASGAGSATIQMTSGTGSCTVSYSQAGNANYNSAPGTSATVAAVKAAQVILVTAAAPASAIFGASFNVAATSGSGLAVTYSSPANDGCSNVNATFTMTSGVVACQVQYNQSGNDNYAAAQQVVQSVSPVGYVFEGFFAPIDMPTPTSTVRNKATAGQTIPVKWRLTLNGAPVAVAASFAGLYSYEVSCTTGTGEVEDAIEEYATGASGLIYDGDGQFHFNWKTSTAYKGKCRALYVAFNDGSLTPVATFKF